MKLETVLAIRRAAGASTDDCAAAVRHAETSRREMLAQAEAADCARRDVMTDDKGLAAVEREAAASRLAAERLAAILPDLRADLAVARARDARSALLVEYAEAELKIADLRRWQAEDLPQILALIGAGLRAQDRAGEAVEAFKAAVGAAYETEAMRDGGPLGVTISSWGAQLPRTLFPGWTV